MAKKVKRCPLCGHPYVKAGWLRKHMDKYEVEGYRVFQTGVFKQSAIGDFV